MTRQITLYTRRDCHLCDSARYVLDRALAGRDDVVVQYVDIDHDELLRRRYNDHVPVILLDGVEHSRHRLDPTMLRSALDRQKA